MPFDFAVGVLQHPPYRGERLQMGDVGNGGVPFFIGPAEIMKNLKKGEKFSL